VIRPNVICESSSVVLPPVQRADVCLVPVGVAFCVDRIRSKSESRYFLLFKRRVVESEGRSAIYAALMVIFMPRLGADLLAARIGGDVCR
jgi:hypothetical protein